MGYQKHSKLNQLHRLLPEGLVADSAWFTRMGYPSSLRSRYLVSGWLQPATLAIPDEVTGLLLRRNQARAEKTGQSRTKSVSKSRKWDLRSSILPQVPVSRKSSQETT